MSEGKDIKLTDILVVAWCILESKSFQLEIPKKQLKDIEANAFEIVGKEYSNKFVLEYQRKVVPEEKEEIGIQNRYKDMEEE